MSGSNEDAGRPEVAGSTVGIPTPRLDPVAPFVLGRLPRVVFGAGTFARVPEIVAGHGSRVLVVTGGRSLADGGRRETLLAGLAAAGVTVAGEAQVTDEPSPAIVDGIAAVARAQAVDVVLGIGGGSVLDAAKAVAGLVRVDAPVTDFLEGLPGARPWPGPAVPLVAVPTTAGTGSEATRNAVISERGPAGYKRSFRDERLVPADAVVDPDLLAGLGRDRIAANGMDALTQLLESYVSTRASVLTDVLALDGVAAACDGLIAWHADPGGPGAPAARSRMAYAALLSGICLAHAGLGAVHGLASPLGAHFPVPHGAACGATLAAVTEANVFALRIRHPDAPALVRYATLGRVLTRQPTASDDVATGALVETLRDWTERLGVPGLAAWGMDAAAIPSIVADARGSSMRTNPVVLSDDELAAVLRASL